MNGLAKAKVLDLRPDQTLLCLVFLSYSEEDLLVFWIIVLLRNQSD